MLNTNFKTHLRLTVFASLSALTLLAASCNQAPKTNTLERPASPTSESSTQDTPEVAADDNGQVAGTQTVQLPTKKIKVGGAELEVEVADTAESQVTGLSNRDKLDEGKGMLFDFTNANLKKPGFWMKDMLFSIDIIWINNGKVVDVKNNAPLPPDDGDLPIYYPPTEITHVLEVPAGWAAQNKITAGTAVSL